MKKEKSTKENNISESLKKLASIVEWFDSREEIDIEEGLLKVKEGAQLIKASRQRLKEIDNEFKEVEKDLESSKIDRE